MKKVVTLDAIMVSFISAMGYGFGFILDEKAEAQWKDTIGDNKEVEDYTGKDPYVKKLVFG